MPRTQVRRRSPASNTGPRRAIIYRRISQDRTGEEAGVTRQDEDCQEHCVRNGYEVVANLVDDDISASRYARKKRPGYQEAIRLIEAGEADVLVGYHLDRLWRQPKELEHLIDLVETRDVIVATLYGDIDLMTAEGRFNARSLVNHAAMEADNISRRVLRGKKAAAAKGVPHGGRRVFGYNGADRENGIKGGFDLVPEEAEAVADGACRFLAGEPLISIARRWNAQGLKNGRFDVTHVRQILENPRYAGLRVAAGEVVGKAVWPAIISEADHHRIVRTLADPARKAGPRKRALLTGLVRCGICGARMFKVQNAYRKSGIYVAYACRPSLKDYTCRSVSISAPILEGFVEDLLLALCDRKQSKENFGEVIAQYGESNVDTNQLEIDRLEHLVRDLDAERVAGTIDAGRYLRMSKDASARIEALAQIQTSKSSVSVLAPYLKVPGRLRGEWADKTLDEKRVLLGAAFDQIVISRAKRMGPGFDKDRVEPRWKEGIQILQRG